MGERGREREALCGGGISYRLEVERGEQRMRGVRCREAASE